MNKYFKISFLAPFVFAGCTCHPDCDSYEVKGYFLEKDNLNYKTTGTIKLNYGFITEHSKQKHKKERFCVMYYKSACYSVSDEIINDSTVVFCNKPLKNKNLIIPAKSNLLNYLHYPDLVQNIIYPAITNSKTIGRYDLDLNSIDLSNADLTTPFIFTIQMRSNNRTFSDTALITINP